MRGRDAIGRYESCSPGGRASRGSSAHRIYRYPDYYAIAFSYRDVVKESGVIRTLIDRHSGIPVSRILELGCGHAPYAEPLTRRGYRYVGLDLNETMLDYARENASRFDLDAEFLAGDMVDFQLERPADFAFLPLGSLFIRTGADLVSHFDSVSRALRPGALYLLEQCVAFHPASEKSFRWTGRVSDIVVTTRFAVAPVSHTDQTVAETLTLEVSDRGETHHLRERWVRRLIYPQELLAFIDGRDDFEFVGWWKNWSLDDATGAFKPNNRSLVLVRRVEPTAAGHA